MASCHVIITELELKCKFKLITDGWSVCQSGFVPGSHLGPMNRFLLLLDICGLHVAGCPPWRQDGSVIGLYSLLSLSVSNPAELMTTFSVSFETTGFSSCLSRLAVLWWRYSNPSPHSVIEYLYCNPWGPKLKLKIFYGQRSVGQPVFLSGPDFCFLPNSCGFLDMGRPL
jgi:hypothetical protein